MLNTLVAFSNEYGSDPELVLAGGGNTSAKDSDTLYIKGSGTTLGTITADGFVKMDRKKLSFMMEKDYPESDKEREAAALADMMDAKYPGQESKRPSVETLLHALFSTKFVLHLHPAAVNGLTCAVDGKNRTMKLFPEAVWVEICKPGYILAKLCAERMDEYRAVYGKEARLLFLQNHGVFFAADTREELAQMLDDVTEKISAELADYPDFSDSDVSVDNALCQKIAKLYSDTAAAVHDVSKQSVGFSESEESVAPLMKPFTPDHIVYCKANPLYVESERNLETDFADYKEKYGYAPKIVVVKGKGFFAVSDNEKQALTAQLLFRDAMKIAVYSRSFGGYLPMTDEMTDFIVNWEVEAYRAKQAQ
ncbi:MAG: class II aldolase/adducin family protein [Clostridia bacterium]|nr:class II aldolase/adducin family protein [Clostridia bacterium]